MNEVHRKIPKIPHAFFKWYCRPDRYEELHGDLEELFHQRIEQKGVRSARMMYLFDVIRCCQPYAWKKPQRQTTLHMAIVRNYYLTSTRNILKSRSQSAINVTGLAIGIASFVFIVLYIINEVSYDRFHSNFRNIYRINNHASINGDMNYLAATNSPITKKLLNDFPQVVNATRIIKSKQLLIGKGDTKFYETRVLYADSTFFEVFDFKLLRGDSNTALAKPCSIVLTESAALKYFGHEDPLGKQLSVEHDTTLYMVTGIVQDSPVNSHIQFDMLGSMVSNKAWNNDRWIGNELHAYVLLQENTDIASIEAQMQDIFYQHVAPEIEYYTSQTIQEWEGAGNSYTYKLVPLADIHLKSVYTGELEPSGNISYIYIYAVIGLIILFIAIFNYVNMATARATARSGEVGIRKVMGSPKSGLIFQFIIESTVVSILAAILALVLIIFFTPSFHELIKSDLAINLLSSYHGLVSLLGLAILVGILAGSYPAFILAGYKPIQALKSQSSWFGKGPGWLRNFLVVLQFCFSIIIIIGTIVVYQQIDFMLAKNLGFDRDQVLVVNNINALPENLESFQNDLLLEPTITAVTNSKTLPSKSYAIRSYRPKNNPETFLFLNNLVGYDYQEVMKFEMQSGRFFSRDFPSDTNAIVINQAAASAFGFEDPIGQQLTSPWHKGELLTIIGVVKNYNIESLHKRIEPVALELKPVTRDGFVSVKLSNDQSVRKTVRHIEDTWYKYAPEQPLQYAFLDAEYDRLYQIEATTGRVFLVFAALSIFIACLGLVGLISYNLSKREKEIGIRKVLGANAQKLIWLLSRHVVKLIIIATVIGWPLAYFGTGYWLQNFADRVETNPLIYLVATLIVLLIGSFSISLQTVKASTKNPVESLRQE